MSVSGVNAATENTAAPLQPADRNDTLGDLQVVGVGLQHVGADGEDLLPDGFAGAAGSAARDDRGIELRGRSRVCFGWGAC